MAPFRTIRSIMLKRCEPSEILKRKQKNTLKITLACKRILSIGASLIDDAELLSRKRCVLSHLAHFSRGKNSPQKSTLQKVGQEKDTKKTAIVTIGEAISHKLYPKMIVIAVKMTQSRKMWLSIRGLRQSISRNQPFLILLPGDHLTLPNCTGRNRKERAEARSFPKQ